MRYNNRCPKCGKFIKRGLINAIKHGEECHYVYPVGYFSRERLMKALNELFKPKIVKIDKKD